MTHYETAHRLRGEISELPGSQHHPAIQWGLMLCQLGPGQPDETPWCSGFVNLVAWLHRLPRSKSAAARSWLGVGTAVPVTQAREGDVVVLQRGVGPQPGPEVLAAPGHVGFCAGLSHGTVMVLGGNQSDAVTVQAFSRKAILGVRRLT